MQADRKTKAQLLAENAALRRRIAELESQRWPQDDIHQRQRVEDLLHRSELRYRTLFESAGDAIIIMALDGRIIEANRAACDGTGYTREELRQKNIADLYPPDQASVTDQWLVRARQLNSYTFETVFRTRAGERLLLEVNCRVVEYAGQPAILSIVRDITERKQIEETLRRSEANLAEAQRIAHFGSWTWNLAADKLQCSDEMFRLVGLQPQEIEVTPEIFLKFLHPDEVEGILLEIERAGAGEAPAGLEHRLIRSNGEVRHVYSRVKVYRDENGSPLSLLGSTQDITDLKQAERALRQYADEQAVLLDSAFQLTSQLSTQDVLRSILRNAMQLMTARTAAIALYEPERDVLVVTMVYDRDRGAVQEMMGTDYRPGEGALGQAFQQSRTLVIDDYAAWEGHLPALQAISQTIRTMVAVPLLGRHATLGVLVITGDEHRLHFDEHDAKLIELFAVQAAIALENAQLYERQQEQYRRLQDAQTRLIQAEKMSALGRLIASISHEINNPLQAIQGCLTLIREGLEEETAQLPDAEAAGWLRDLDVASTEVQRIATIVQRLRDFYRPARPGLQTIDVSTTIDTVLALTSKQMQHTGIALEWMTPTRPPITLTTNTDQLKQIILNLVLNAIDAMPGGGSLRVAVGLDTLALGGHLRSAVRIEFTDTGHGISPENLARIFEPFFTTKDTGSGLGLSISYELIKELGGDISVVSEVGVGTTFTIRLPIDPANK